MTPGVVNTDRTFTRRQWFLRHAIMGGATPSEAREAISSVAIEHDWDMDGEEKTMAEWDMMENNS